MRLRAQVEKKALAPFLQPNGADLAEQLTAETGPRFRRLNAAMGALLDDFSLVRCTVCGVPWGVCCCAVHGTHGHCLLPARHAR